MHSVKEQFVCSQKRSIAYKGKMQSIKCNVPLEIVKLKKRNSDDPTAIGQTTEQPGIGHQLLYDDVNIVTVGEVKVGTPPQTLNVVIDTSVADLWLPGRFCAFYGCGKKTIYDSSKSRTFTGTDKTIVFDYQQGTVYGTVVIDKVCMQSFCSEKQNFIQAYQTTYNFWEIPYDGVLGLAPSPYSLTREKNVITNLAQSGTLNQSIFTIWKAKKPWSTSKKEESGLLTIGDYDRMHCSSFCTYRPSGYGRWDFRINGISVGQPSLWKRNLTNAQYYSAYDCATSSSSPFILGPSKEIMRIARSLKAKYNPLYKLFYINCDDEKTLMPVWFNAEDVALPINPENYIIRIADVCLLAFQTNTEGGPDWVLGEPWFKQYCVVHDLNARRIGFCASIM
ncbi:eukaryotic aspartyl protease [Trichuris suis]|nr:eukaryotic aspartyl protease [Trichuris suis]